MSIQRLYIQSFRSLSLVDIELSPQLNVFFGENASGKTSLLEAIHVLGAGRSFLTHKPQDIIQHEESSYIISAQIQSNEKQNTVGIKRDKQSVFMKINGQVIDKTSTLARYLPFQIIHPESHLLISAGPSYRRRFMDWGLFHVEQSYNALWSRYQRALKQRNAVLRQRIRGMEHAYDEELSKTASIIHEQRAKYMDALRPLFKLFIEKLLPNNELEVRYQPGWDVEYSLNEILKKNQTRDWQKGFTSDGPHRADLKIKIDGYRAEAEISRGQQKMLVLVFRLAQLALFNQQTEQQCLVMIDDLASELDEKHRQKLLEILSDMNAQIIVSCIDYELLDFSAWSDKKMFHVEHGQINPVL